MIPGLSLGCLGSFLLLQLASSGSGVQPAPHPPASYGGMTPGIPAAGVPLPVVPVKETLEPPQLVPLGAAPPLVEPPAALLSAIAKSPPLKESYDYFFAGRAGPAGKTIADLDALLAIVYADAEARITTDFAHYAKGNLELRKDAAAKGEVDFITREDFPYPTKVLRPVPSPHGPGFLRVGIGPWHDPRPACPTVYDGGADVHIVEFDLLVSLRTQTVHHRELCQQLRRRMDMHLAPLFGLAQRVNREHLRAACRKELEEGRANHRVVLVLTVLRDEKAKHLLLRCLRDWTAGQSNYYAPDYRTLIIKYLGEIGAREAAPLLLEIAESYSPAGWLQEPGPSEVALQTLAAFHNEAALAKALAVADRKVLLRFDDRRAVDKMAEFMAAGPRETLQAMTQVRPLSQAYLPLVEQYLAGQRGRPLSDPTYYAYWALKNIGSDRAKEVLMRFVCSGDRFALYHLAGFPSDSTAAYLLKVFQSGSAVDWALRDAAAETLRGIPEYSVPQLLRVLDTSEGERFDGALAVLRKIFQDRVQPAYSFLSPQERRYRYPDDAAGRLHSGPFPFTDPGVRRAAARAWRDWWEKRSR